MRRRFVTARADDGPGGDARGSPTDDPSSLDKESTP
jgi:hypothetical protein